MKKSLVIIITLAFKRHNTTPSTIIITFAFKLHHNSTTQRKDSSSHLLSHLFSHLSANKMTEYNKFSEVSYNPKVRAWRFRVKIHRIYPFYSYVTNSGPFYTYVLADKDGFKIEMTVYGDYDRFRGLEKEEGSWVEIFLVEVERSYPDTMGVVFNTEAHFDDPGRPRMVFYIRDNMFNLRLSEVEDFRQSLLNNDPYVQKYGVESLV
ncbi:hypothetical protein IGI04_036236 [Brassica rapa subsp. trilocularis]|uniref:DUF223 domain-containing protein n=1 Tax=Brassica rapa subsp. trilocularis TaxID=1813537 RepID=A0ABQ7LDW5_BRACM|nr:hypothetical protein IGI04_036236 [Brassica rapa subsp. trilocularis]